MKTKHFIGLLAVLIFTQTSSAQTFFDDAKKPVNSTRIVIVYPTVDNIKTIVHLIERKLIAIPNLEVVGLYHEKMDYNFEKSQKYIEKNKLKNFYLHEIKGELNEKNIFNQNDCSAQFRKAYEYSNGVIFFGGPDIPPVVYGQKTNLLTDITQPERHFFELSFLFHLLGGSQNDSIVPFLSTNPNYVVYGFCLGMQTINVATGGTLYQDIPTQVYNLQNVEDILQLPPDQQHRNYNANLTNDDNLSWSTFQHIQLIDGKFFTQKMKLPAEYQPFINSSHHQAVDKIGKNLEVAAYSMDGKIVEALTHTQFPNVLGVQFHPERSDIFNPDEKYHVDAYSKKEISFYDWCGEEGRRFHQQFWNYYSSLFNK